MFAVCQPKLRLLLLLVISCAYNAYTPRLKTIILVVFMYMPLTSFVWFPSGSIGFLSLRLPVLHSAYTAIFMLSVLMDAYQTQGIGKRLQYHCSVLQLLQQLCLLHKRELGRGGGGGERFGGREVQRA